MAEALRFPAIDGRPLAGTVFRAERPRGAVVIAAAMGVPQRYYARFAEHLAEAGLNVLTFDYRGIAESRDGHVKDERAALHDWGELDLAGALAHARTLGPVQIVTHSVGGQIFGLVEKPGVHGALFIASQSGHWREWKGLQGVGMAALSHALMPGLTGLLGYLPMRAFGQGEDLPRNVGAEWARWIRHPLYVWGYAEPRGGLGFSSYAGPICAYAISDDFYAPKSGVETLLSFYRQARRELRVVRPEQLGVPRIGHFGVFRDTFRPTLWREWTEWLLARVA
jgi:predicted alpha/beta hydrolase